MSKKIGFMFLIKDSINKIKMWKDFFEGNYDKCNIYIHASAKSNVKDPFIKKYLISETEKTKWGNIYPGIKCLQKASYAKKDYKMVLLSESTIPVKSFDYIYDYLTKDDKSYMSYCPHLAKTGNDRGSLIMQYQRFIGNMKNIPMFAAQINIEHWYFNECWHILNTEHTGLLVKDKKHYNIMKKAFAWDENFPSYVLSFNGELKNVVRKATTFVNWGERTSNGKGGFSPKSYDQVKKSIIYEFEDEHILFARKFAATSNIDDFISFKKN